MTSPNPQLNNNTNHQLSTIHLHQIRNVSKLLSQDAKEYKFEQLLHNIMDTVCGTGPGIRLSELIEEQNKRENPLSLMEIQTVLDSVKMFVQRVMSKELSTEQTEQELNHLGLTGLHAQTIVRVIDGRRGDLVESMQRLTVSELSQAHLHDFDWKLHLVIASDKCSNIREPVLLLNLRVKKQNINQDILVELTKDDLDKILKDFNHINNVLKKITM